METGAIAGSPGGPFVISNPNWCGQGGAGTGFGCYDTDGGPPISDDFFGVFWSLGTGSPDVGVGDDNGAWRVSNWSKQVSIPWAGQMYHYPAWLTLGQGLDYVAGAPFTWSSSPLIDGCVANEGATTGIDGTECTCVLLNDQWGGLGYFALLASRTDELGDFHLSTGGDISLKPIPRPRIVDSRRRSNGDVELDLVVDPPGAGIFQQGGCDCGVGYKVFAYVPDGPFPADRSAGWFEPRLANGGSQPITPFGQQTTVVVDCDETRDSVFVVSARVYAGDGFRSRYGGPDSAFVQCLALCSPQDSDGDGVTECEGDCDDGNAEVYPGAPQVCDGISNDCATPHWPSPTGTNEFDDDADFFSECQGDCDDTNPARFPGNPEVCDGLDNDCADGVPPDEVDSDSDGFSMCRGDCDDGNPMIHPGSAERCNALDDDCDSLVDEDERGEDTDGDGVRNACDNCPVDDNPPQDDRDGDSYGDACDNCVLDRNPSQSDVDSDNEGDGCDLDDGMIYIVFHRPEYVEWQEEAGFASWNSYRGDLEVLRSATLYTQDPAVVPLATRSCDLITPWVADVEPPAGTTVFFLTTGNFAGTGAESSLGLDSSGVERPSANPCP